ncbi:hypothetical protein [Nocardioides sp. LHG3406-4]|uniref:hypothetical protein n=1 Tax=Nocardioides sp. LHG3406-4 TaxID=2804575 RepID=UPI003CEDE75C
MTHLAEVLAIESACLAGVTDEAKLTSWRCRVVEELMKPRSPYALALRQTGDVADRADFLDQWCGLIEEAVNRLLRANATAGTSRSVTHATGDDVDPHTTSVMILAALHGGSALSQVAQDPWPLNAALDLALAPLCSGRGRQPR